MSTYCCKSCESWMDSDHMAYVCEDCYVNPVDFVRIFKLLNAITDLPPSVRDLIAELPDFLPEQVNASHTGAVTPSEYS